MRNYSSTFGENLKWLRRARGLTQRQLAQSIRLRGRPPCRAYITQIELGVIDPRLSTIRALARALGVKPWYLVADLGDNVRFWEGYLALSPAQKREVQRVIDWQLEGRRWR